MKDFYKKNLYALKYRYPDLWKHLKETPEDPRYKLKQLNKNIYLTFEDKGVARVIGDYKAAEEDLKISFENQKTDVPPPRIILYYGLGLGHQIDQILAKKNPITFGHIILEHDIEVFRAFLHAVDRTNLINHANVFFLIGMVPISIKTTLIDILSRHPWGMSLKCIRRVTLLETSNRFLQIYKDYDAVTMEAIKTVIKTYGNSSADYFLGVQHIIQNIETIIASHRSVEYKDICKGLPGIVICSGPSLDLYKDRLKELNGRAVIICCDSSLKISLDSQLELDAVATLERHEEIKKFFEMNSIPNDLPLFCLALQHPEIMKTYGNRPLIFSSGILHFVNWLFPKLEPNYIGPTVSNLAIAMLHRMGCSTIAVLGNDLAYDPFSGKSHTENVLLNNDPDIEIEKTDDKIIEKMGNCELPRKTNQIWAYFSDTTTFMINKFGLNFYNVIPKEYGIQIIDSKRIDFDDLLRILPQKVICPLKREANKPVSIYETTIEIKNKLKEAQDFLSNLHTDLSEFLVKLESKFSSNIKDYEKHLDKILTFYPLFSKVLMDVILPFHTRLFIEYYALPLNRSKELEKELKILTTWTREMIHWVKEIDNEIKKSHLLS